VEVAARSWAEKYTCHRSDMALEDTEHVVPELKSSRNNVIALATYFCTSECRTKARAAVKKGNVVALPSHYEVKFTERLHRHHHHHKTFLRGLNNTVISRSTDSYKIECY
jgi:hypothetical protein